MLDKGNSYENFCIFEVKIMNVNLNEQIIETDGNIRGIPVVIQKCMLFFFVTIEG